MQLFRCRVCTHPYLTTDKPTHCPFCGARQRHIVLAKEYKPCELLSMEAKTHKAVDDLLTRKIARYAFFSSAAKVADLPEGEAYFMVLARLEQEHIIMLTKMMGIEIPEEFYEPGDCSPSHRENIQEFCRTSPAITALCEQVLAEETDERTRLVIDAFIDIENDHLICTESREATQE